MRRLSPLAVLLAASLAQGQEAAPLSPEEAAALAAARNPAFRAVLQEEGIAQADLEQAGLPANPRVHGALRYIGTEPGTRGHELGVKVDLLSLLAVPLQRRVASGRLEQARFRISQEALGLETRVKEAYYAHQAAQERLRLSSAAAQAAEASAELARRLREAGNISALELAQAQAEAREAVAVLAGAESAAARARESLALLLGVQDGSWRAEPSLRPLPASDPDPAAVEAAAVARRWDLQAARKDPQVLAAARRAERASMFGGVEVGVDTEREYGGATGYGPEFELGVPLFDRRQKAAKRLEARRRQSLASAEALEQQARFEVRAAAAALAAARKAALALGDAAPLKATVTAETLKNYNYMLMGADRLLAAKRRELEAAAAHVDALAEYWTRRAELERAAGGRLPVPEEKP